MGERGARNEPASPADIAAMAALVRAGIAAGALGFSTSRTIMHRAVDGEPVPGTYAAEDELFGIGQALGELTTGVFELAPAGVMGEDLAAAGTGGGLDAAPLGEHRPAGELRPGPAQPGPGPVARMLDAGHRRQQEGRRSRAQVAGRPPTC